MLEGLGDAYCIRFSFDSIVPHISWGNKITSQCTVCKDSSIENTERHTNVVMIFNSVTNITIANFQCFCCEIAFCKVQLCNTIITITSVSMRCINIKISIMSCFSLYALSSVMLSFTIKFNSK